MQAIVVSDFGGPEVLELREVPDPSPAKNQIVVQMRAVGVNPVEAYKRAGTPPYNLSPLPHTPGTDGAGEIVAAGADSRWKIGDRVYLYSPKGSGTYAQFCVCDDADAFELPSNVSFEAGAALGVPYATAHRALFGKANAKAGEFVFVHGATGGVGVAAVQIALAKGCKVGGSAGSAQGEAFLEALGVRYTTNHNQNDYLSDVLGMTCGRGCDVLLEMLANVNLPHVPDVMAPFGRVVIIGNRGTCELNPRAWMGKDLSIFGMTLFNVAPDELRQIHAELGELLRSGALSPVVCQQFPLAQASAAHEAVMQNGKFGKIVLSV